MKLKCTIAQRRDGQWVIRHSGGDAGDLEVTAASRDEALGKMRDELRYRLEFCAAGRPIRGFADRIGRDAMSRTLETAPTRLAFLLGTLWFLCTAPLGHAAEPARRQIALREGWLVKQLETDKPDIAALARESASPDKTWLSAQMPAQVHDVLLAHGLIADPHVGRNAAACAWVGEKDWAYVCQFPTPEITGSGPAFLRFEGLDTLATVWLNGAPIGDFGDFENMFREYACEVSGRLARPGQQNTMLIVFSSPLRFMQTAKLPPNDPSAGNTRVCGSALATSGPTSARPTRGQGGRLSGHRTRRTRAILDRRRLHSAGIVDGLPRGEGPRRRRDGEKRRRFGGC